MIHLTTINEITAKTILTKTSLPGCDYVINPYNGCQFACMYCYAAQIARWKHPKDEWGTYLDVKINATQLLKKELEKLEKKYNSKDLAMRRIFSHDILKGLKLLEKDAPDNLIKISSDDKKMINNLNKWYGVDGAGKKFEYYGLLTGIEVFKEEIVKRGEYPELPSLKDLEKLFDKFLSPRIVKYIAAA